MRGKDFLLFLGLMFFGITPAYAGKSCKFLCKCFYIQDHPRLCGEKSPLKDVLQVGLGSPPPMRGKDYSSISFSSLPRITPAYAGKSDYRRGVFSSGRDHPRLCGEKHLIRFWFTIHIGITPAYAGKRSRICRYSRRT